MPKGVYKHYPHQVLNLGKRMLGKHHSEKTKLKMKLSQKGRVFLEEHKKNLKLKHADFKGKNHPNWQGGKPKCLDCGKQLNDYNSRRCSHCAKILKLHPNWKGGISFEPYPVEWTKTLKESIRQRDNYTCQLCGRVQGDELKERNRKLAIHHIDYDKSNLDPENLITLCCSCNTRVNLNRKDWTKYFKEGEAWKKQPVAQSIRDIIKKMGG